MSKRPQSPAPGSADDAIVVIVKRNDHSGTSALLIAVLLVLGAVWALKSGQSKAAVPAGTPPQEARTTGTGKTPKPRTPALPDSRNVTPDATGVPSPVNRSSGRATFFEPTEDEEPAPAAP